MKIGMNLLLWTDHPTKEHDPLLEKIKKWGFDGVEFPVIAMEKGDISELAKRCDGLGLARSAILAFGADQADPVNPDPKLRQAAVDLLKSSIDKTRDIGADILVGPFQQGLGRFTGAGPAADEWKRAAEVIRQAAAHAATMHVDLAVEPLNRFEMFLFNTIDKGAEFCRDVFRALRTSGYDRWLTIEAFGLDVPSLITPLHLWRPLFEREEDVPVLGLKHVQDGWKAAA